ncbi:MAG: substrate-binding domain-containing protein [Alphaproteobacteria bacterium]|nr:substrate-binding domain-containing protein [Alphaproteobacteria bacterium]
MRLKASISLPQYWLLTTAIYTLIAAILISLPSPQAFGTNTRYITVASTTSTQNSGLFRHILPQFTKVTGIEVRVVAVGTGAAVRIARNGDADVLLVHHKASEEHFVARGFGVRRHPIMFNDFVIIGPRGDPARISGGHDAVKAFIKIANTGATFVSRGDGSGTHKRELELWDRSGRDFRKASGRWYRETGSGMGATLNIAAAMGAHALADRGTWLSFANKRDLAILVQGDPSLRNEYGAILVSSRRHEHVKSEAGQAFIDWLTSNEGRAAINGFAISGKRLFTAME